MLKVRSNRVQAVSAFTKLILDYKSLLTPFMLFSFSKSIFHVAARVIFLKCTSLPCFRSFTASQELKPFIIGSNPLIWPPAGLSGLLSFLLPPPPPYPPGQIYTLATCSFLASSFYTFCTVLCALSGMLFSTFFIRLNSACLQGSAPAPFLCERRH